MAASPTVSQSVSQSELSSRESLQANSQTVAAAEAGDSAGTHREEYIRCWKLLPSCAVKTMTKNTSLCVTVSCKV
jgi:hypothetical protein